MNLIGETFKEEQLKFPEVFHMLEPRLREIVVRLVPDIKYIFHISPSTIYERDFQSIGR